MRKTILCLAALLLGACLLRQAHPGLSLIKRRCTRCHTEPDPDVIERKGLGQIVARHPKVQLTEDELRQLREYLDSRKQSR
jgi:hypothetical protein